MQSLDLTTAHYGYTPSRSASEALLQQRCPRALNPHHFAAVALRFFYPECAEWHRLKESTTVTSQDEIRTKEKIDRALM